MIKLEGVTKTYKMGLVEVHALRGVCLDRKGIPRHYGSVRLGQEHAHEYPGLS